MEPCGSRKAEPSVPNNLDSQPLSCGMNRAADYSTIWENFEKVVLQNKQAWLIREPLGNKSIKQLVQEKIKSPRFFKGVFRLFGVPGCKNGQLMNFMMTNEHTPFTKIAEEVCRILRAENKHVDPTTIEITFKGRAIHDEDDFAETFNWNARGGEIFNLRIRSSLSSE